MNNKTTSKKNFTTSFGFQKLSTVKKTTFQVFLCETNFFWKFSFVLGATLKFIKWFLLNLKSINLNLYS